MTRSLIFWIMMLLWLLSILGLVFEFYPEKYGYVSYIFLFILFGLLGWDTYGPAVKGK